MLFTQPLFFAFFALVFGLAWSAPSNGWRKGWLLLASYAFYGAWDWRFLALIAASTLLDFVAGRAIAVSRRPARRRAWLGASLGLNLGMLATFKYFDFFLASASGLLRRLGIPMDDRALGLVLPVGISFFTFQTLSYTIDIYRGKLLPVASLLDFSLFVAFFPQLVAGPIVRASAFLPQLATTPRLTTTAVRRCLALFLLGFAKKVCIADNLAPLIDPVFAHPAHYTVLSMWIAVLLYAVQIYCDFSGYTDMAIACAGLLGYELGVNFAFPYLATSIADFWRRWHISLSTWLRDYLYIPLGGNRGCRLATARNLMLTMVLGGLWHGAAWTFVAWGALHGAALVLHRMGKRLAPPALRRGPAAALAGIVITFYSVCVAWIFFRAQSFGDALRLLEGFVLLRSDGPLSLDPLLLLLFAGLAALHVTSYRLATSRLRPLETLPNWGFALGLGAAAALVVAFLPLRATPFIYFQF